MVQMADRPAVAKVVYLLLLVVAVTRGAFVFAGRGR